MAPWTAHGTKTALFVSLFSVYIWLLSHTLTLMLEFLLWKACAVHTQQLRPETIVVNQKALGCLVLCHRAEERLWMCCILLQTPWGWTVEAKVIRQCFFPLTVIENRATSHQTVHQTSLTHANRCRLSVLEKREQRRGACLHFSPWGDLFYWNE